jgi:Gpi18-like mannosyltransferase
LAGAQPPAGAVRIFSTRAATWELLHDVLPVVLVTRLVFLGLTLLLPLWRAVMGMAPLTVSRATGTPFDVWNRWDARWYDDLARLGYNLHGPNDYKNVAFFPLYPLLERTLHDALALVGRDVLGLAPKDSFYPPYLVPGMILANLCAVAALSFFYGYLRLDHDRVIARRAVTLLALSPLSFYLFAAYSESTFLLCALAFFCALQRRWRALGGPRCAEAVRRVRRPWPMRDRR